MVAATAITAVGGDGNFRTNASVTVLSDQSVYVATTLQGNYFDNAFNLIAVCP